MSSNRVVRRDERAVFRRLEEGQGGVVLHLETAAYHGVNETGAYVWELLAGAPTVGNVVKAVHDRYGGAEHAIKADVERFLGALEERSLVIFEEAEHQNSREGAPSG